MKRVIQLFGAVLLFGAGAALQEPAVDIAASGLIETDRRFDEAAAARGVAGWLEFFAEDATIFPEASSIITGLSLIRQHYEKTHFSPHGLRWRPLQAHVSKSGDLGYTYGTWELSSGKPGKAHILAKGKYTTIWRRQADGSWKVVLDLGTTDCAKPE